MKKHVLVCVCGVLFSSVSSLAQVATGIYPFGPFSTQGFDTVNLANLNAHFSIPVFSKPGRGGTAFHYNIAYDSAVWTPVISGSTMAWQPATNWGWTVDTSALTGYFTYTSMTMKCFDDPPGWYSSTVNRNFMYIDPSGIYHYFPGQTSDCSSYGSDNIIITANDGSGYVLNAAVGSFRIRTLQGNYISPPVLTTNGSGSITDTNGNQTTTTAAGIIDTTGTTVIAISGTASPSSPRVYTYPVWESSTSSTTSESANVYYSSYNIKTNFDCSGITEYSASSVSLISSVVLADGETYSFSYEPTPGYSGYVTGRLNSITLPTGGVITYTYSGGNNGIVCTDGGTSTLTRTMNSSSGAPSWTFTRTPGSTLATTHTVVTDGLSPANSAVYDFVSDPTDDTTNKYYQTSYKQYEGAATGTPLLSAQTCYNNGASPCTAQPLTVPITSVSTVQTLDGASIDKQVYAYSSYGLITEEDDYDFVSSGTPSSLIRKVTTEYAGLTNIAGAISDVHVYDGSGNILSSYGFNYDEGSVTSTSGLPQHVSVSGSRGNITSKWILNEVPQSWPTQHFIYDDAGQMLTNTDVNGNSTSYTYDSGTDTFLYHSILPTTGGISHTTSSTWDVSSGVKKVDVDQNGNSTSYTYDALLRPASTTTPGSSSASTSYAYNLASGSPYISVSSLHSTGSSVSMTAYLDPYGRQESTDGTDSPHDDLVAYAYDGNGNQVSVSNPYRSGDTPAYTTYSFDALGRNIAIIAPDNSPITYGYSGNSLLITDAAAKKRQIIADGIGRISKVFEPDSSNNLTIETDYLYAQNYTYSSSSGVSYQTIIQQKGGSSDSSQWRQRIFTYDQPGRILSESTPEGGQISYTYASYSSGTGSYTAFCSGNYSLPCSRTDANGTVTSYIYDTLNRLIGKNYSGSNSYSNGIAANTPSISVYYDQASYNGLAIANGIGQRTGMSDGTGQTAWSFDSMGRSTATRKTLNGVTKQANYTYNIDGTISLLQDFSGVVFTYSYDSAGRQSGVTDNSGNSYASNASYNAASQLTGMTHQLTSASALYARTINYNDHLQISSIGATLNGSTIQSLTYGYGTSGTNNDNILTITNGMDSSRSQAYAYDTMNRLASGQDTSHWGETYTYDNWGNLYQTTAMSGLVGNNWSVTAYANNRLSNLSYDSAGEVTQDQIGNSYSYDAEGRILTGGSGNYAYDGDGYRVKKTVGSTTTLYWPGAVGGIIDESDGSGTAFGQQVQVAGLKVWSQMVSGAGVFLFQDHLGSTRVTGDASGNLKDDIDYYPYGGIAADYGSGSGNHYLFTGYESDATENSTDYVTFRNLSYTMGRFNRPDPYDGSYDQMNPQSLNRYGYVLNSPLTLVDPLGLCSVYDNDTVSQPGVCDDGGGEGNEDFTMQVDVYGFFWPPQYLPTPFDYGCEDNILCISTFNNVTEDGGISVATGFGPPSGAAPSNPYQMIKCTGVGRGLAGNTNLVGRQGGIPGQTVQLNTAAVTPTQFNVPNGAALSPFAPYINGTVGNAYFNSVTDVNGGRSPIPGVPVRTALQQLFPGQLILEIPGATDQGANAPVTINVPQSLGCPAGTHQ